MTDSIDTSQWTRLGELFDQAVGMDATAQVALLRATEHEDAQLARVLASLLAADARHRDRTSEHQQRMLQDFVDAGDAPGIAYGDRVGPWVVREELGRGGMSVVFRAERVDGELRQEVALKVVRRALLDAKGRERFLRERQIVAGFQHPCIARLLDVGQTAEGSPYLAMELVRGLPITDWCDARRLDTRARVALFLQVCEAVQHANANQVLHCDLKPSNVLVGRDGVPKLIDFGIAKPLGVVGDGQHNRTATAHRFFSPSNVAPEQLRGEPVGVACDVYQLGTLLHELLSGTSVFDFEGLTPGQLEQRILEVAPEAPSVRAARTSAAIAQAHGAATPEALARALRGDLDAIVAVALRKPPRDRYASAARLADDLRRSRDGHPVAALRGQGAYRARKFLRRHALAIGSATVMLMLACALVAALRAPSPRVASAPASPSATQPDTIKPAIDPARSSVAAPAEAAPAPESTSTTTRTYDPAGMGACAVRGFVAPTDFRVFVAAGESHHKLDFDFDRSSGQQATQNDIVVNHPDAPVVLILGNAGPVLWNLAWTKGTRIAAVFVSGRAKQVVAGLPDEVPLLVSTQDDPGACEGQSFTGGDARAANPLSIRLFGRPVDKVYPFAAASGQDVNVVGDPLPVGIPIVSGGRTPESYRDPEMPWYGDKGLDFAVEKGLIRRATAADFQAWTTAQARMPDPGSTVSPMTAAGSLIFRNYVVLKPLKLPGGLYGGDSATFFVPEGVPRPVGNPGHSTIYDLATMTCEGVRCNH